MLMCQSSEVIFIVYLTFFFNLAVSDEIELRPVSGRLEIRVVDRSADGSHKSAEMQTARENKLNSIDMSRGMNIVTGQRVVF